MIALFAGTGALPGMLAPRLAARGRVVVCEMDGFAVADVAGLPVLPYRVETFGTLLARLDAMGVRQVCLAGALRRPRIDPAAIDAATLPLIPALRAAMALGDDGALRGIIELLQARGWGILAAGDVAPDLLPPAGIPTRAQPGPADAAAARLGQACIADLGRRDQGQACIVSPVAVLAVEDADGTDAMLARARPQDRGMLYKSPKPGQDRRADLPVIGPATAAGAASAGLAGIIIAAGGVMVLDLPAVIARLDADGLFLWIRPGDAS